MPEFVHSFTSGRMNKDLDERLIPNGEYRDALNLDLANSEGANVGTLQNVKGNREQRGCEGCSENWSADYIDALQDPVVIGSIRHDETERIYWFIAAPAKTGSFPYGVSAIAEYDQTTDLVKPVLVDTAGILKFSQDYLITGINILDKFLFWTDDQTEPKKINIEKFKTGSVDFTTHTKIPKWLPDTNVYQTALTGQPDFVEADITVAKLSPLSAPDIDSAVSEFGNGVLGTGTTPASTTFNYDDLFNFTYVPDTVSFPNVYEAYPTYADWVADHESLVYLDSSFNDPVNNPNYDATYGWDGHVTFILTDPVPVWNVGNIIILEGEYDNGFGQIEEYSIQLLITEINNTAITGQIQAISSNIQRDIDPDTGVSTPIRWEILLQEKDPMFEYVFPRFAYRWKYIDGEYSCFSPFSNVAFIGNDFEYVSSDGYNIGMTNNIRKLSIDNLTWGSEEVAEVDVLYKESNSVAVYVVDTLKRKDYTSSTLPTDYTVKTELITKLVESNQLLRPWDNVPKKAKAQEIIGNRVVYGNYEQNYDVLPSTNLNASLNSQPHPGNIEMENNPDIRAPKDSLKSIRTYQVGVLFKDKYGRETPVFTSEDAGVRVPISEANKITNLRVTPISDPPSDSNITHYKFLVKETSNEYYNLALDRFYLAEDGNVWLSFPSSERNKVDEETYLILKKQHDNDTAVTSLNRYKILSISNEAPRFVSRFDAFVAGAEGKVINGGEPGFLQFKFEGPDSNSNESFGPSIDSSAKIVIKYLGISTDQYNVKSCEVGTPNNGRVTYTIQLTQPFGDEMPTIPDNTTGVVLEVYKEENRDLPEFEGRFFAKINRNFAFDTNIIESFAALEQRYAVKDEIDFRKALEPRKNDHGVEAGYVYGDRGNDHGIDGCSGNANGYFLNGVDWGGAGNQSETQVHLTEGYNPPINGNNTFGFQFLGHGGDYVFIDSMVGTTPARDNAKTPNGYIAAGARLRFKFKDGEESKVYIVQSVTGRHSTRGGEQKKFGGSCRKRNALWNYRYAVVVTLTKPINEPQMPDNADWGALESVLPSIQIVEPITTDGNKLLSSSNPAIFETEPKEAVDLNLFYEASDAIPIANYNNTNQNINWFNCYSYGNGVESNRIRDDYNAVTIDKGAKVSTVLDQPYAQERRGSGFIFSQIYNSTSGINRLNQFIQAEPITKDLNPIHGTIQKLHARDTDLITLCEDKCFRVLANKDALYNADGNVNLTGNNAVLGQAVPYAGEFGISKNPESFASYGFRVYFSDKNRGAVIRLSRDGITEISSKGMSDFFENNLRVSNNIIGSYDSEKGLYNITLDNLSQEWQNTLSEDRDYQLTPECNTDATSPVTQTTISFKEEVDGWTSRKSFIQESGISLNNRYYTFKNGLIWEHGLNVLANNFYSVQYDSSFNVIINEMPQSVKGFSTLNYTGTQSRLLEYWGGSRWYSIAEINASQLIPTAVQQKQPGWYVNYVKTDLEGGEIKEFQKKEGKKFNYIKALEIFNDCEIIGDGIGPPVIVECDPQSYNFTITIDEECSSTGDGPATGPPDEAANMWYKFNLTKPPTTYSIQLETSANNVVCTVNEFFEAVNGNYAGLISSVSAMGMKWHSSAGLNVGTQMYHFTTEQPLNYITGYYIFLGEGVSTTGLDPDYPHSGPGSGALNDNTLIIKLTNGVITEVTQYNTITPTC